ncbi:MAG: hypothetical protein JWM02_1698 [Frankiales bacterium]|nr:hypothetical protein [Frankiales bacterium]
MSVAGLLLAAGGGRRFGSPKALIALEGELLVERGARVLHEGGCAPVVVALGAQADQVQALASLPEVVVVTDWESGMGASLRAGLRALEARDVTACVVALADQPRVGAQAVARLVAAHAAGAVAAVATYDGVARNPVLLDRRTWVAVAAAAHGDVGARDWLRAHPALVTQVPCEDTGSPFDIDTPADLEALA